MAKTRWLSKICPNKEIVLDRFAFVVRHNGFFDFVIPEINLRGSEPTDRIEDVVSLLVNVYGVREYQIV